MNGRGRGMVVPSAVTWRSSMASRRADWDRADARFSSSAINTLVKMGPGRNTGSPRSLSRTMAPVTSAGKRSAVNCTRWKSSPNERARALAKVVFPRPGRSSTSRWPWASRHPTASCTIVWSAYRTLRTASTIRAKRAPSCWAASGVSATPSAILPLPSCRAEVIALSRPEPRGRRTHGPEDRGSSRPRWRRWGALTWKTCGIPYLERSVDRCAG